MPSARQPRQLCLAVVGAGLQPGYVTCVGCTHAHATIEVHEGPAASSPAIVIKHPGRSRWRSRASGAAQAGCPSKHRPQSKRWPQSSAVWPCNRHFNFEHVVATTGSALRFCGRLASKKKRCESQSGMSGGLIGTRCSTSSTEPPSWMAP